MIYRRQIAKDCDLIHRILLEVYLHSIFLSDLLMTICVELLFLTARSVYRFTSRIGLLSIRL